MEIQTRKPLKTYCKMKNCKIESLKTYCKMEIQTRKPLKTYCKMKKCKNWIIRTLAEPIENVIIYCIFNRIPIENVINYCIFNRIPIENIIYIITFSIGNPIENVISYIGPLSCTSCFGKIPKHPRKKY